MMKKVTLFFDKTVRDAERTPEWNMGMAYQAALNQFAKIVAFGGDQRIRYRDCDAPMGKFTCGCHAESNAAREMFGKAHRVEACITRRWSVDSLTLEFKMYRIGETKPADRLEFTFAQDGSLVGGGSGGGY
jgi:hypothetical protein